MHQVPKYGAPEAVVVVLINETVNGPPERRLAAKFLLNCVRRFHTKGEIEACLHELDQEAIVDIASEARQLATKYGVINRPV